MNKKGRAKNLIAFFIVCFVVARYSLNFRVDRSVAASDYDISELDFSPNEAANKLISISSSTKNTTKMTTAEFIELIQKYIQVIAWENNINASALLAEAILKSDTGNNEIAKAPNYNVFAVEGRLNGEYILSSDNKEYKKYPSYKAAITDYVEQLLTSAKTEGVKLDEDTSYSKVSSYIASQNNDKDDYQKKLDDLVNENKLTELDEEPSDAMKAEVEKSQEEDNQVRTLVETKQLVGKSADEGALFPNQAFSNKDLLDSFERISVHDIAKSIPGDLKINKEKGDGNAD